MLCWWQSEVAISEMVVQTVRIKAYPSARFNRPTESMTLALEISFRDFTIFFGLPTPRFVGLGPDTTSIQLYDAP